MFLTNNSFFLFNHKNSKWYFKGTKLFRRPKTSKIFSTSLLDLLASHVSNDSMDLYRKMNRIRRQKREIRSFLCRKCDIVSCLWRNTRGNEIRKLYNFFQFYTFFFTNYGCSQYLFVVRSLNKEIVLHILLIKFGIYSDTNTLIHFVFK